MTTIILKASCFDHVRQIAGEIANGHFPPRVLIVSLYKLANELGYERDATIQQLINLSNAFPTLQITVCTRPNMLGGGIMLHLQEPSSPNQRI